MANKGQRMVFEDDYQYLKDLRENHQDPSAEWGGGGGSPIEAGTGIEITGEDTKVISLDTNPDTFEVTASTGMTLEVENENPLWKDSKLQMTSAGSTKLEGTEISLEANNIYLNSNNAPFYVNNTTHEYKTLATTDQLFSGDYDDLYNKPTIPTKTSDLDNDSGFITGIDSSDVISALGYTPGTSNFDGNYNSLTNKPTIPTKTSELTNNSGFITSSDLPTNHVTTNTQQTISGEKTFTNKVTFNASNNNYKFTFKGNNPIQMIAPSTSTTGFTLFNSSNVEKGYFQYNARSNQDALYLGRYSSNSETPTYAQNLGFLSEVGSTGYRILIPNKTNVSGSATTTRNTYYIPTEITDGTTTIKATSEGAVNISSLLPTVGDGTITVTQGGVTKGTFTVNQTGNTTIALDAGSTSDNDLITIIVTGAVGTLSSSNLDKVTNNREKVIVHGYWTLGTNYTALYDYSTSNTVHYVSQPFVDQDNQGNWKYYNWELTITLSSGDYVLAKTDTGVALKTNLASVAFSGDYTSLSNTPTVPTTATSTSTVTPSTTTVVDGVTYTPATETLTFTYDDDTTATVTFLTSSTTVTSTTATVMTGASVSTTTTLS